MPVDFGLEDDLVEAEGEYGAEGRGGLAIEGGERVVRVAELLVWPWYLHFPRRGLPG